MSMQWQCSHCNAVFSKTDYWQPLPLGTMPGTIRCASCGAIYIIKDIQAGKHDVDENPRTGFAAEFVADTEEKAMEKCPRCGDELPGDDLDCPHCACVQWVVIGCISALSLGLTLLGFWGCDSGVWSWTWIAAGFVLFLVAAGDIAGILLPSVKELIQGVHMGRLAIVGLAACIAVSACIVIINAVFTCPLAETAVSSPEIADKTQQEIRGSKTTAKTAIVTLSQVANKPPELSKLTNENAGSIASPPVVTPVKPPDSFKLIEAARKGDYNAAMNALQSGTSPDAVNNAGTPAIVLAAQKGNSRLVKLLLDYKANVNARDSLKYTALMWASARGRMETARLLLKNGANPLLKNAVGETALTISQDAEMEGVINQSTKDAMSSPDAAGKKTAQ